MHLIGVDTEHISAIRAEKPSIHVRLNNSLLKIAQMHRKLMNFAHLRSKSERKKKKIGTFDFHCTFGAAAVIFPVM